MPLENVSLSSAPDPPVMLGRDPIPIRAADARLVARLRRGDAEAGRGFVRDHHPGIYRYLLRLTGDREAAEDLTQETFVEAWRSLATYEGRASLRVWLCVIARRQFIHWLRRRPPLPSLEGIPEPIEPRAAAMEERVLLRDLLDGLPLELREIVALHYVEGYTCEEISAIVGAPTGTIKYRLFAARARLREAMSEDETGGTP